MLSYHHNNKGRSLFFGISNQFSTECQGTYMRTLKQGKGHLILNEYKIVHTSRSFPFGLIS